MNEDYDLVRAGKLFSTRSKVEGEHIIWTGAINNSGYPMLNIYNKVKRKYRSISVGRTVLALANKLDLNSDRQACHIPICERKDCIKEEHLYNGSHQDNMDDRGSWIVTDRVVEIGKPCPNGHMIETMMDVYKDKTNNCLKCRICDSDRKRRINEQLD